MTGDGKREDAAVGQNPLEDRDCAPAFDASFVAVSVAAAACSPVVGSPSRRQPRRWQPCCLAAAPMWVEPGLRRPRLHIVRGCQPHGETPRDGPWRAGEEWSEGEAERRSRVRRR
jgi:hypothetical protein